MTHPAGSPEQRVRHARETIAQTRRLLETPGDLAEIIRFHQLHARHERELGHDATADRAELRARNAQHRPQQ